MTSGLFVMHPSVWYFAHPVGPPCACPVGHQGSTPAVHRAMVACNVRHAKAWLRWVWSQPLAIAVVAPWLGHVELLDDAVPAHRERGLRDNAAIASIGEGILHFGPRVSSGMSREECATLREGTRYPRPYDRHVLNLTTLGATPPRSDAELAPHQLELVQRLRALR